MKYDPKSKALQVPIRDADLAAGSLRAAIHYHRKSVGLPVEGYDEKTVKQPADTAEFCILKAAESLGIDLGATQPGQLDVRNDT